MLGQHHSVDAPELKEPGFFSIDGESTEASLREYDARYASEIGEHTYWMDGSTSYAQIIRYPGTINRIADHAGPGAKFIYVVRDPLADNILVLTSDHFRSDPRSFMKVPGVKRAASIVLNSPLERVMTGMRDRVSVPVEKPTITPETLGDA